jgi:hypothetical protein
MCDPKTLAKIPLDAEDFCYMVCSSKNLKDILQIERFDPTKTDRIKIDTVDEKTLQAACKAIHRGFLWFKQKGLSDMDITTYTLCQDVFHLEAILTSGFLKIPVHVESSSGFLVLHACEDFAFLDLNAALNSFNSMDFTHAKFLFENIQQKAEAIRNIYFFKILVGICDFYIKWENFCYFEARSTLQKLLKDIELAEKEQKFLANIRASLMENQKFLDRLLKDSNNLTTLSLSLLLDIFQNGIRLESLGKHNEAVVRFYRVLEGCVQSRFLTEYGIRTDIPDYEKLPVKKERISKELGQLPIHIAFNDGFRILCIIGDELARRLDRKLVKSLQQIRNYSVLVHGIRPLTHNQSETAREFAEQALRTLFSISGADYDSLCVQSKACSLNLSFFMELLSKP